MAEDGRRKPFEVEGDVLRFHSLVAALAVGCYAKGRLAVMAGSACAALLHLGHGDRFPIGVDYPGVVAGLAGSGELGDMAGMAENHFTRSLDLVADIAGFTLVAADAILFAGDAEGLDSAVAGAAGLGLFHLGHGVVPPGPEIEDRIVAHL